MQLFAFLEKSHYQPRVGKVAFGGCSEAYSVNQFAGHGYAVSFGRYLFADVLGFVGSEVLCVYLVVLVLGARAFG